MIAIAVLFTLRELNILIIKFIFEIVCAAILIRGLVELTT